MTIDRFRSMGCKIVVGGAKSDELREVGDLFAGRDRTFSRFRSDSELSRVNTFSSRILVVSDELAEMLRLALRACEATGGVVDPTVGAALARSATTETSPSSMQTAARFGRSRAGARVRSVFGGGSSSARSAFSST